MPNFYKLQLALKNTSVRIGLAILVALSVGTATYFFNDVTQDSSPVVRSQNISEITALASQRDRLDYLMVAKPLSEAPRYIFKYKDSPKLHVVKVPSTSHLSLEREILLRNAIPMASTWGRNQLGFSFTTIISRDKS